eukprot:CAMPEP_0175811700 /NCGR_PEP_ID=MMETSP0107_2-20121207/3986_1 /TAXON_ID=195067 ORGANISM="Goniomonas pacifica, Strain CCMP1869" /NCGR_SAMPLE_ID=MMETSP0107_2 /ASSEMBLY_ACC=CAM_ASM_000203 /LENGTH=343 /DNA_ID=CAMNT_0017123519 /DNA_START=61 /DNA_END=1092 /DNA_ORIENTATION=+
MDSHWEETSWGFGGPAVPAQPGAHVGGSRAFPWKSEGKRPEPENSSADATMPDAPAVVAVPSEHDVISVKNLTFTYEKALPNVLTDVSLNLPVGCRCLFIGANGAGKSTLLRILGGKHMIPESAAHVLGRPAFHDTRLVNDVAIVAERWSFVRDVSVAELCQGLTPAEEKRKNELLEVLDIDEDWRCYRLSDGQRRRVQILVTLLRPVSVMLLDEITTDLDVVGRQNLLKFLYLESGRQGTSICYATHIFDGLDGWASHIAYIRDGKLARFGPVADFPELSQDIGVRSPLFCMVEKWLRDEWHERRKNRTKEPEALAGMQDQQFNTDRSRSEFLTRKTPKDTD